MILKTVCHNDETVFTSTGEILTDLEKAGIKLNAPSSRFRYPKSSRMFPEENNTAETAGNNGIFTGSE